MHCCVINQRREYERNYLSLDSRRLQHAAVPLKNSSHFPKQSLYYFTSTYFINDSFKVMQNMQLHLPQLGLGDPSGKSDLQRSKSQLQETVSSHVCGYVLNMPERARGASVSCDMNCCDSSAKAHRDVSHS